MITILAVTDGFKHFGSAITEYGKRLGKTIELKPIKPISHTNPEYIRIKETLMLGEHLQKMRGTTILLDERGEAYTTRKFTEKIEDARMQGDHLIFVIGGSYGVNREIFGKIPHKTLRISDFVMPHSLALLVLMEQIYRAHEILKGSSYHHA